MRISESSVSPHISSIGRKHRNHNNNNSHPENPNCLNGQDDPVYTDMGMSPDSSDKADASIATSATEYSSAFFPRATFGDSVFVSPQTKNANESDELETLERVERILRFAQKRLKKSKVEGFFEKKKKKYGKCRNGGGIIDVRHSDLKLDSILGNGSYNVVYSVKRIKQSLLDPEEIVVKTLRSKLLSDLPMLAACAADLRKEGLILASLQQQPQAQHHQHSGANNIVKVLAWTPTGLSAFANGCHDSFFLVLERLDRTLTDTLKEWKTLENVGDNKEKQQLSSSCNSKTSFRQNIKNSSRSLRLSSVKKSFFRNDGVSPRQNRTAYLAAAASEKQEEEDAGSGSLHKSDDAQIQFWKMRLNLLMDLCDAVSFLHSQRVLHRDLKPDNVGFDRNGKLKVFDFDVARVLPHQANWGDYKNETFKMTKKVGSPRYMSPEVSKGESYNEKSDVYALGLLAYEMLSLKRPFNTLDKDCVPVVVRGEEPSGGRQKRRNSFPFRRPIPDGGGSSSGKLQGIAESFFRRRSRSRGSYSRKTSRRNNPPKYANIRPLLPIATPHELGQRQLETTTKSSSSSAAAKKHNRSKSNKSSSYKSMSPSYKSTSCKGTSTNSRSHHHAINDIDLETSSFFWTQSLRTTIDRAWSYDIPTRPFASELKVLLGGELDRIEWHEMEEQ